MTCTPPFFALCVTFCLIPMPIARRPSPLLVPSLRWNEGEGRMHFKNLSYAIPRMYPCIIDPRFRTTILPSVFSVIEFKTPYLHQRLAEENYALNVGPNLMSIKKGPSFRSACLSSGCFCSILCRRSAATHSEHAKPTKSIARFPGPMPMYESGWAEKLPDA